MPLWLDDHLNLSIRYIICAWIKYHHSHLSILLKAIRWVIMNKMCGEIVEFKPQEWDTINDVIMTIELAFKP